MLWTDLKKDQRVSLITEAWDKDCSASSIAAILSEHTRSAVSRNAVIGIYTRNPKLQLTHPLGGGGKTKQPTPRHKTRRQRLSETVDMISEPARKPTRLQIKEEHRAFDASTRHIPLWEVKAGQCHWSVNNPAPNEQHLFCGFRTQDGHKYCEHHRNRSSRGTGVIHYGDI
jgi:hypothetical protein